MFFGSVFSREGFSGVCPLEIGVGLPFVASGGSSCSPVECWFRRRDPWACGFSAIGVGESPLYLLAKITPRSWRQHQPAHNRPLQSGVAFRRPGKVSCASNPVVQERPKDCRNRLRPRRAEHRSRWHGCIRSWLRVLWDRSLAIQRQRRSQRANLWRWQRITCGGAAAFALLAVVDRTRACVQV